MGLAAFLVMCAGAVVMVYPYAYMVGASLKTRNEFSKDKSSLIPPRFQPAERLKHARGEPSALDWAGADWPVLKNYTDAIVFGQVDVFLAKFNFAGTFQWVRGWGGTYEDVGMEVYASGLNDIFITGYYYDTVDFDPGPDVDEHTSIGQRDIFLSKFTPDGEW